MNEQSDQIRDRRAMLSTTPALHPRHDAIVTLHAHLAGSAIRLRYVPDRDILDPESLTAYLRHLGGGPMEILEIAAQTVLEDINDQVIPCWLEITLNHEDGDVTHHVRIEDRQPNWQERGLLNRLEP